MRTGTRNSCLTPPNVCPAMPIFDLEAHYIRLEQELFSDPDVSDGHASYLIEGLWDIWIQLPNDAKDRALDRASNRVNKRDFSKNLPHLPLKGQEKA